jgi:hypothetical protein
MGRGSGFAIHAEQTSRSIVFPECNFCRDAPVMKSGGLDRATRGRNETGRWFHRQDEYDKPPSAALA